MNMLNRLKALNHIKRLDEFAKKKTNIHRIHPLVKILTTGMFLIITVSFHKYQLGSLLPLIFYPIILIVLAELPWMSLLTRMFFMMPFIIGIGIFNPLFDCNAIIVLPGIEIARGWLSFLSILLKGMLTLLAAFILIATTGIDRIAIALQMMRVPRILIMQLLLTYRYIIVLIEEVSRMMCAYSLRASNKKGIQIKNGGSLIGHLLMRTWERAQRIYDAMCCRGFTGAYSVGNVNRIQARDRIYFIGWSAYFLVVRYFNIPQIIGAWMIGGG